MTSNEILIILEDLLHSTRNAGENWIDEHTNSNPFDESTYTMRYSVEEDMIVATNLADGKSYRGTFKQFLWNKLHLDFVCNIYKQQYAKWMELNHGIPYVETEIVRDYDEIPQSSYKFIRSLWDIDSNEIEKSGLKLLMAEYGMGKSSFCQGVKKLASEDIKSAFFKDDNYVPFPFVFDLNEYRNSAFDEFVKNRLSDQYGINIKFSTFKALCQAGLFSVVLDAWDQMHNTPIMRQTRQDISQFSDLWKDKGRVLITCRRSFYQKQLHMSKNELLNTEDVQAAKFYTLSGFNENSARDYFENANTILKNNSKQPINLMWIGNCWKINRELFNRPLNLKLLVKHYDVITEQCKLDKERVETYQFLQIILSKWKREYDIKPLSSGRDILKSLVMLTLEAGLNRSVSLDSFKRMLHNDLQHGENLEKIINNLKELDFVSIGDDDQIEFRLAAYQEFLWADYVLEELEERKLCMNDNLLNRFMLPQEVRSWIARELKNVESDCLKEQLTLIKYKVKADVGYSGSNVITLLRDLKDVGYYKKQLSEIIYDLNYRIFDEADLRGLNLSGANFEGSSLVGADLSYTKLDRAIFSGVNLSDVTINEYGKLQKCAFLNDSVVVGTESGSLITFSVIDRTEQMQNLADETIRDVATDMAGVYTASQDGWISYINKDGQLKNAYIVGSGLQSIETSGTEGSAYVGANCEGLYRYNWNSGNYQKIHVTDYDGETIERFDVSDIHCYMYNTSCDRYVAYISDNNRSLVLLQIDGLENGTVVGKAKLYDLKLKFGDICFADNYLIYSIVGKGVYYIPVDEMYRIIDQAELLSIKRCLYKCISSVELAWVKDKHILMIVEKTREVLNSVIYILFDEDRSVICKDIEWIFDGRNHAVEGDVVEGFCVSNNGKYIALSGEKLAVLELFEDEYYQLIREPIEAKISCDGSNFKGCIGLTEYSYNFLRNSGAKL